MSRDPDKELPDGWAAELLPEERAAGWQLDADAEVPHSLVELVNRVLDRGVVVQGDVTISVAGVDLVYLGLSALLTSVATARRTLDRPVGQGPLSGAPPPRPALPGSSGERAAVGSLQRSSAAQLGPAPESASGPAPEGTAAPRPERPEELARAASEALGAQLAEVAGALPPRIDVDPDGVQRDLGRLVLTLVELLRRIVEHQAVRRMEDDDLSEEQIERMGSALLQLEEKMKEIKAVFGLADEELNIDLGPLGKLL